MERTDELIRKKLRENFFATLFMTGSSMIANIIDRMMVGNLLGSREMAAISLTSPVIFVINVVYGFYIYGGSTLAATYKGRRDQEKADECFTISILGGIALCMVFTVIELICFVPLVNALSAGNPELSGPVGAYLLPLLFFGPLVILTNGTTIFIRNDSLKLLSVAMPIICNVVNLLMDYVFMGILGFGVRSAGWATNIGYLAAGLLVLVYLKSDKRTLFFRPGSILNFKLTAEIFHTGLASAVLNACLILKNYLLNTVIVTVFGSLGAVVMTLCLNGGYLTNVFYMGSSQTMMPIGGALYGEKDYKGIRYLFRSSVSMMLGICCVISVLLMLIPNQFAMLFGVNAADTGGLYVTAFRLFCISIPVGMLQMILRSHLQSCGYRNEATVFMVLDGTVCFIPFLYLFQYTEPELIWLCFTIAPVLSMAFIYFYMRLRLKKQGINDPLLLPADPENASVMEVTIHDRMEDVETVSGSVLAFCRQNGIPDTVGNKLWLAIQELCSNIVQYAYKGSHGAADVFLKITDREIILRIRDNGIIFNPTEFTDDGGRVISGLQLLNAMKISPEYNRVLGFNNTIVTILRDS